MSHGPGSVGENGRLWRQRLVRRRKAPQRMHDYVIKVPAWGGVEPASNVTPQHARKSQRLAGSACLTDQEGVLMAVVCRTAGCMLHRDDGSPGFMQKEARHRGPRVSSRTPSLRLLGIKIVKMKLCNRTKNIS